MRSHYTAQELAGLPGMPSAKKNVIAKADRERWPWRKRAGRGGGKEYALDSLPAETQAHLKDQHLETIVATAPAVKEPAQVPALAAKPAPVPMETLPDWQRNCADARLMLLCIVRAGVDSGCRVKAAINKLVAKAEAGELGHLQSLIPQANARSGKSGSRTLSARTVLRWWSEWKNSGFQVSALVPDSERQPRPEPAWAEFFMTAWKKPQKPHLTDVLTDLAKTIPTHIPVPSYDQARRYLSSIGALERNRGRMTGNELATLKSYRRRLTDHMFPGDAYTADGHTFDAEVAHPFHGRPFRPEVTPVIDIATRMVVGWSCDLAESGLAVLDALRGACEMFGPPVIFYTDNGKGYKNQIMTAPGTGILARLDITPEYSRPRNPQAHGVSERAHQTVLIKAARELCTYIGSTMDGDAKRIAFKETRKAIKEGESSPLLIEWDDFVEHVNQAIMEYNNRPHRGLPAYRDPVSRKRVHYTPAQYWQIGMKQMMRELPQEQWTQPANELPDLYHPAMERTVNRGWIRLGKQANGLDKMYHASELGNWTGERVMVAFSPSDPSKVWVRDLNQGRLIAVAKLNGNADPYFAQSYIEEKREKRGQGRLKRLELKAEEARLEMQGPQSVVIEHSPTVLAKAAPLELVRKPAETVEVKPVFSIPPTQGGKYQYWCRIDERISAGEEISDEERRFHTGFQKTAAWESERMFDQAAEPVHAEM